MKGIVIRAVDFLYIKTGNAKESTKFIVGIKGLVCCIPHITGRVEYVRC